LFRKELIAYGIIFYLGTLSIVSNILFPVGTHMAERLLFMPSLGFCFALAVLGYQLSNRNKTSGYKALYPALGVLGIIVLAFSIKTIARNTVWKNNYTLFTNDIYHSPNSAKLRNAVGGELLTQYAALPEGQQNPSMLQEAEGHLLEAIKIHPNYKNAYLLLGNCNYYQQEFDVAVNYYQQALGIDPNYQEANDNLFLALREAGEYFGEKRNDIGKATSYLQQAYQINPNDFELNRLLGVAYGVQGNTSQAISFFEKALSINREDASTWLNLSSAYFYANMPEKAEEAQRKALEIDPNILQERGQ
jgi:tetratricopeptide (TPR) repeat protein